MSHLLPIQIGETDIFALNLVVELAKKLRKDEHVD
jgi:hypothetical protein